MSDLVVTLGERRGDPAATPDSPSTGIPFPRAPDPGAFSDVVAWIEVDRKRKHADPEAERLIGFLCRWTPFGDAAEQEILGNFGMTKARFRYLLGAVTSLRVLMTGRMMPGAATDQRRRCSAPRLSRHLRHPPGGRSSGFSPSRGTQDAPAGI